MLPALISVTGPVLPFAASAKLPPVHVLGGAVAPLWQVVVIVPA